VRSPSQSWQQSAKNNENIRATERNRKSGRSRANSHISASLHKATVLLPPWYLHPQVGNNLAETARRSAFRNDLRTQPVCMPHYSDSHSAEAWTADYTPCGVGSAKVLPTSHRVCSPFAGLEPLPKSISSFCFAPKLGCVWSGAACILSRLSTVG